MVLGQVIGQSLDGTLLRIHGDQDCSAFLVVSHELELVQSCCQMLMESSQLLQPAGVNHVMAWCCPTLHTEGRPFWMSVTMIITGPCPGRLLWWDCCSHIVGRTPWMVQWKTSGLFSCHSPSLWYTSSILALLGSFRLGSFRYGQRAQLDQPVLHIYIYV